MPDHLSPVTVTLNPAIDQTVFLDALETGSVNRATRSHQQAGGKGVNVSSMLAGFGIPNTATGFLGRDNPNRFENHFASRGIQDEFIRIDGETRTAIKLADQRSRQTTDINLPGSAPTPSDITALHDKLSSLVAPDRWFVISGSLPPGFGLQDYARLLHLLQDGGAKVAVDTSGPALKLAIDSGVDLIKPNHHELAQALAIDPSKLEQVSSEALALQRNQIQHVLLSMGPSGCLIAAPDGVARMTAPEVEVASTVGAGDALLAGYLIGLLEGETLEKRARCASGFAGHVLANASRPPLSRQAMLEFGKLVRITTQSNTVKTTDF